MAEEEQLIQSGFDSITKAFSIKSERTQMIIEEKDEKIADLRSQLSLLTEQNEKLQSENAFIKQENKQIKAKNAQLVSSLEETQSKLKTIQKSVLETTSTSLTQNNIKSSANMNYINNNDLNLDFNTEKVQNELIIGESSLFDQKDIFHQYKNHSTISTSSCNNTSDRLKIRNTFNHNHHPIILNKDKYSNIETRINQIKGHLSSLDNAIATEYPTNHMRINSSSRIREKLESQPSSRISTPNHKLNIRAKILSEGNLNNKRQIKNDRYELTNKFLNECNLRLDPQVFEQVLIAFQSMKEKRLGEEKGKEKIYELIQSNSSLVSLLKMVFKNKKHNESNN